MFCPLVTFDLNYLGNAPSPDRLPSRFGFLMKNASRKVNSHFVPTRVVILPLLPLVYTISFLSSWRIFLNFSPYAKGTLRLDVTVGN